MAGRHRLHGNQAVAFGGSSYVCVESHASGTFAADLAAAKWELMAAKGDKGDTGDTGAPGADGLGTGDVVGPASVVANRIALFDGLTGKLLKAGSLSEVLDMVGSAATGDLLYRSAAGWTRLPNGTAGQYLRQNTALTTPEWVTVSAREVLTADRTYYVRTDGSNSNDGLTNTAGGAFLTIQKAIDVVASIDLSIYDVTIQVGNGTYTAGVSVNTAWVGKGAVTLVGNTTTPSSVVISTTSSNAITVGTGGALRVGGLKLQTTTSGCGIFVHTGSAVTVMGRMEYGACAQAQIQLSSSRFTNNGNNYTISGGAPSHILLDAFSYCQNVSSTITLTGTPAFASFINCSASFIQCNADTFSGAATGARYSSTANGIIQTFGSGASYLPGNAVGGIATQGQYL